ncbi:hypothetical protein AB432_002430 [Brevibacillus brevis]|uniref:Uncharacterized protein n=1 Tax=Brevibacillus brevis TaxID=1393 RepID=A0A2Z4MBY0_BREBE|nr:hypothetical protein AB432_002430 [Brevibacillus brevis]
MEKYSTFQYFLECYFNVSANYNELYGSSLNDALEGFLSRIFHFVQIVIITFYIDFGHSSAL